MGLSKQKSANRLRKSAGVVAFFDRYSSEYIGELAGARRSVCGPFRRRYGAKGQVPMKNGEI